MNVKNAMTSRSERESLPGGRKALPGRVGFFVLGAACVVVGSELLIDSACVLARQFHISEEIISVTILAMGTSLPEFVTTIIAILKKESSLSVGNIVGANVIDTAFILPICTLITRESLTVAPQMAEIDMPYVSCWRSSLWCRCSSGVESGGRTERQSLECIFCIF